MKQSEAINELATALSKAQGEMENAAKNANNPHFKSRYADLAEIWNTIRAPLAKNGLSVVQSQSMADGVVTVETLLMHSSGQWVRTTCPASVAKLDPQGIGSAITYLRRYSLAAACGIAQEDDDGEGATNRGGKQEARRQAAPGPQAVPSDPPAGEGVLNAITELIVHELVTAEEREKVEGYLKGNPTAGSAAATLAELEKRVAERANEPAAA